MTRDPHTMFGNLVSLGAIAGVFEHVLPTISAFVGTVWCGIMIYESRTFHRIFNFNREDKT